MRSRGLTALDGTHSFLELELPVMINNLFRMEDGVADLAIVRNHRLTIRGGKLITYESQPVPAIQPDGIVMWDPVEEGFWPLRVKLTGYE